jgi:N-dimethylarginine dimethylaminohydrolase
MRAKTDRPRVVKAHELPNKIGSTPHAETLVMCPPEYLDTAIGNNVFMKKEKINVERALRQFGRVKHIMEAMGVHVLEIPAVDGCQDQYYVANIGIAIEPYIVLAKYKAPGRACEVAPARKFFEGLGYQCIQPPDFFEGEADLKHWKDNKYFGGVGQFSDDKAMDWIEKKCGVEIIRLKEVDPKLFHLDCSLCVVNPENLIVNRNGIDSDSFKKLSKLANIIEPPKGIDTTGITNGVLLRDKRIYMSGTLQPEQKDYRKAIEWLNRTMDNFGYSVVFCDVDECDKSGADLSCCVFHLTF